MQTKTNIVDNRKYGTVADFLSKHVQKGANVSIVSAYFTIYAYEKLKSNFDSIESLRFLFGEPSFIAALSDEFERRTASMKQDELEMSAPSTLHNRNIAQNCHDWLAQESIEIRSVIKSNFLHGKMYHINKANGHKAAITGSSNFTLGGLGLSQNPNIELNLKTDSNRDIEELEAWFDELWKDDALVEDVKAKVLEYLESFFRDNDPEFVYYKTLYHVFEGFLAEQSRGGFLREDTNFFDTTIWNTLYEFQQDGVKGAINKILKHNGCVLADSVGLGKTYEALAVIKYFELLNYRVLVLCPAKLSANWTVYQASKNNTHNPLADDRFQYNVLYHTDLGRETGNTSADAVDLSKFNWSAYDLVVIDESHNFKGNPRISQDEEGKSQYNRTAWLMEKIIKAGGKTKVLMLSATPVNNTLKDLRNQIAFMTEGREDALLESCGIGNIGEILKQAQAKFTIWAKNNDSSNRTKDLLDNLDSAFFKLLDELTISRSRKHIKNFYDISKIGAFPERDKPVSLYPKIDTKDEFETFDSVNLKIEEEYDFSVFHPFKYIQEDMRREYENRAKSAVSVFSQMGREQSLIGMMRVGFLKRLESSIHSFRKTLDRTIDKIEKLEEKLERFKETKAGTISEAELEKDLTDEIEEEWTVGKKFEIDLKHIEIEDWLVDLKRDREALEKLRESARKVVPERDSKLIDLKTIIKKKVNSPFNDGNKKVLVFTAFADTANYLYDNLKDWCRDELGLMSAVVCGTDSRTSFGRNDFDEILTNFSPRSKTRSNGGVSDEERQIDILFATDCISEGQNLQDCDCIINYDIHWNPVRIIQRFGRIDRIGSINKKIRLINFWPTKDLDNYIKLKDRVESRMALVDVTATADENLLNQDEIKELAGKEIEYRAKQLARLKEEVLDLEDISDSVSMGDFNLEDFRAQLMKYIQQNKRRLIEAPEGIFAVVPDRPVDGNTFFTISSNTLRPGLIFCLRQKKEGTASRKMNPLSPYFLVYVRDDKTVRYNFTHAKNVLEIFSSLCMGRNHPDEKLNQLFKDETNNYSNLATINNLLKVSVREIEDRIRKKSNVALSQTRSAEVRTTRESTEKPSDFELVTWLVIRGKNG